MKKILLIWNIVLTTILVGILAGGCLAASPDLTDDVNLNREYIRENREAIQDLANAIELNNTAIQTVSALTENNSENIISIGVSLTEWAGQLEPAIEVYVDWCIEQKIRELIIELILEMI